MLYTRINNMLRIWIDVLKNTGNVLKKHENEASIILGVSNLALAGLLVGFMISILLTIIFFIFESLFIQKIDIFMAFIIIPVFSAISFPVIFLLDSVVLFLFAKILGGKGTFTKQFYFISLCMSPFLLIVTIFGIISSLHPVLELIFSCASSIYGLYMITIALREAHKFNVLRAIITWVVPLIIVAALITLLFFTSPLSHLIEARGEGFKLIKPTSFAFKEHGNDIATFMIMFQNDANQEVTIYTKSLNFRKGINNCSFYQLDITNPNEFKLEGYADGRYVLPNKAQILFTGEIDGYQCGGSRGQLYNYTVEMDVKTTIDNKTFHESGFLVGGYIGKNDKYRITFPTGPFTKKYYEF